ncbi:hypothetical protein BC834DRAFT_555134 [Gloeopeniophorella convolvens]|nr:hypothetical protein BC834DRAFT_555134 [Gloeopeniophorella convolvens]
MATDAGNNIATVYYPPSGDVAVFYRSGQAVYLWPKVSSVKSADLDPSTAAKTIQPRDGTVQISSTSNVAAAWGSGKNTRIFVQGTNNYLQETVWDGNDFVKDFWHIHDVADPGLPILDGDQFDFTIFYQGTDNSRMSSR